jgi:hypothetical protein
LIFSGGLPKLPKKKQDLSHVAGQTSGRNGGQGVLDQMRRVGARCARVGKLADGIDSFEFHSFTSRQSWWALQRLRKFSNAEPCLF